MKLTGNLCRYPWITNISISINLFVVFFRVVFPNVPRAKGVGVGSPILLELDEGIMVFHRREKRDEKKVLDVRPRIPLLGLPALRRNNLFLSVDGRNQWASICRSKNFFGLF